MKKRSEFYSEQVFYERDIVYTDKRRLNESDPDPGGPWSVSKNYPMLPGSRRSSQRTLATPRGKEPVGKTPDDIPP